MQITNSGCSEYTVSQVQDGHFFVQDKQEENITYSVSFGDAATLPSCGCLDWLKYKLPCTHMVAIFQGFQSWDMLSSLYTGNPILTLDFGDFDKMQEDFLLTVFQSEEQQTPIESEGNQVKQPAEKYMKNTESVTQKSSAMSVTDKLLSISKPSKDVVLPIPFVGRSALELSTKGTLFKNQQDGFANACGNVCQELSSAIKGVDDRTMLQKVKLDLQFVLNDVKMELSKLPEGPGDSGGEKRVSESNVSESTSEPPKRVRLDPGATESEKRNENDDDIEAVQNIYESGKNNDTIWLDDPELDIRLLGHHREAILNNEPLSLEIVRCVQRILRHQFDDVTGFADPALLELLAPESNFGTAKKVLQLHSVDGGAHWAASARIGRNIHIFCCTQTSKAAIIQQVLKLIEEGGIGDNILFIERPENNHSDATRNCALYAISYCVAFAFDIEARNLAFDVDELRAHLAECLEDMCFSMFPLQSSKL